MLTQGSVPKFTKEQMKIKRLSVRPSKRQRDLNKPSKCVVLVARPAV